MQNPIIQRGAACIYLSVYYKACNTSHKANDPNCLSQYNIEEEAIDK
jgi:hypothetical protein